MSTQTQSHAQSQAQSQSHAQSQSQSQVQQFENVFYYPCWEFEQSFKFKYTTPKQLKASLKKYLGEVDGGNIYWHTEAIELVIKRKHFTVFDKTIITASSKDKLEKLFQGIIDDRMEFCEDDEDDQFNTDNLFDEDYIQEPIFD